MALLARWGPHGEPLSPRRSAPPNLARPQLSHRHQNKNVLVRDGVEHGYNSRFDEGSRVPVEFILPRGGRNATVSTKTPSGTGPGEPPSSLLQSHRAARSSGGRMLVAGDSVCRQPSG